MIGALQELLIEWVLADDPPETDRLISTAVHIFHRSFATSSFAPSREDEDGLG